MKRLPDVPAVWSRTLLLTLCMPLCLSGCLSSCESSLTGNATPPPCHFEATVKVSADLPDPSVLLSQANALKDGIGDRCQELLSARIPGTYAGNLAGGVEILELRDNGAFTQTFLRSGSVLFTQEGRWNLAGSRVQLSPLIHVWQEDYGAFWNTQRERLDELLCPWNPVTGTITLWDEPEQTVTRTGR